MYLVLYAVASVYLADEDTYVRVDIYLSRCSDSQATDPYLACHHWPIIGSSVLRSESLGAAESRTSCHWDLIWVQCEQSTYHNESYATP